MSLQRKINSKDKEVLDMELNGVSPASPDTMDESRAFKQDARLHQKADREWVSKMLSARLMEAKTYQPPQPHRSPLLGPHR